MIDFPRKPGADDPPERVKALAQGRPPRRKTQLGHSPAQTDAPRPERIRFDSYFKARKGSSRGRDPAALETMTATQLALYLSGLLSSAGVAEVSSWPITGNEGADLLFAWHGKRVVVSVKSREGAASPRSIKQALAARDSYGCHALWLVTSSRFKPSVQALASEPHVLVIDAGQMVDLESIVARQLRLLRTMKTRR